MTKQLPTHVHVLDTETTAALKADLRGEVVLPSDANYDAVRRREQYVVDMIGCWSEGPAEPYVAWAHDLWSTLVPVALDGVYVNTLHPNDGHALVEASYGANYERLVQVKNAYDPTNFFRINHNIPPTGGR